MYYFLLHKTELVTTFITFKIQTLNLMPKLCDKKFSKATPKHVTSYYTDTGWKMFLTKNSNKFFSNAEYFAVSLIQISHSLTSI